jgi:N utilization substance protein B
LAEQLTRSPKLRRRGRECALQFLFGLDFTRYGWAEVLDEFWEHRDVSAGAKAYAEHLVEGVMSHAGSIDGALGGALQNWAPERVGPVERNILRVAIYEMWYAGDVPAAVAINEAIEIARRYGADDAPRFVNGVLDRLREAPPPEASPPESLPPEIPPPESAE